MILYSHQDITITYYITSFVAIGLRRSLLLYYVIRCYSITSFIVIVLSHHSLLLRYIIVLSQTERFEIFQAEKC